MWAASPEDQLKQSNGARMKSMNMFEMAAYR